MLITLYKIGGVHFRLLSTNSFRVRAKKERFTATSSRCRQNLKYENFPSSFGRPRQNIAPKSVSHVQHDYFSSFNQSNYWFVPLLLTLPSSDLKPWSNGYASSRKLITWGYFRLRLARPCVHLRWLAMTCDHFGRDQICPQGNASFLPFGHPTQVNASSVTEPVALK